MRERGERVDDAALREPLDGALLVERLLALDGGDAVRQVVVALLERLKSGVRWILRPRSVFRFVRILSSHARMFVPGVNDRQPLKARA